MQRIVIRNEQDLWSAAQAFRGGFVPGTRFDGWPIMVIRSTLPIDGVGSALAVTNLQEAVYRLYGLMKYGTRNLRRLTTLDRACSKLDVRYQDGNRGITIDFTNAMNACLSAVEAWGEFGPYDRARSGTLFGSMPQKKEEEEKGDWAKAARALGSQCISRLSPRDLKLICISAIFAAGAVVAGCVWIKETAKAAVEVTRLGYEHQLKMAELDRTTVASKVAEARVASQSEVAALEKDLDAETKRVMDLVNDVEQPLLRFALKEVEASMPALMEMAPQLATYSINNFELSGQSAAAVAKAMRKTQKRQKKNIEAIDGWEPQVRRTQLVTS